MQNIIKILFRVPLVLKWVKFFYNNKTHWKFFKRYKRKGRDKNKNIKTFLNQWLQHKVIVHGVKEKLSIYKLESADHFRIAHSPRPTDYHSVIFITTYDSENRLCDSAKAFVKRSFSERLYRLCRWSGMVVSFLNSLHGPTDCLRPDQTQTRPTDKVRTRRDWADKSATRLSPRTCRRPKRSVGPVCIVWSGPSSGI